MAKIGSGHAAAMGRLGFGEIRNGLYPESNIARNSEYGLYGTMTPGEVAESRRNEDRDFEEEGPRQGSVLKDTLQEAKVRDQAVPDREDRGIDR